VLVYFPDRGCELSKVRVCCTIGEALDLSTDNTTEWAAIPGQVFIEHLLTRLNCILLMVEHASQEWTQYFSVWTEPPGQVMTIS
jgi:hypothetical protein